MSSSTPMPRVVRLAPATRGGERAELDPDGGGATVPSCRPDCGACCIAPSISSPLPGLPHGKPAGVPCPHLDERRRCRLFGDPRRPAVCGSLQPSFEMCRTSTAEAMHGLALLEAATAPRRG